MEGLGFWILFLAAMILFLGEPDLHDKLLARMDAPICETVKAD